MVVLYFFRCMTSLLGRSNRVNRRNWFMAAYVFVLFGLGTYWIASNTYLTQIALVDNRNFPTGPIGYIMSIYREPWVVTGNACDTIANWLVDGLLLWRCYVIFSARRWVVILPSLMFMGSIALGTALLYQTSRPASNIFSVNVNFGLAYFAMSTATNVLLTLMISGRLLLQLRSLGGRVGDGHAHHLYTSVATMLIESCALYAFVSLIFMGLYGAGTHASEIFLPTLAQVRILAPLLIVLRVAERRSWTPEHNGSNTTQMVFNSVMSTAGGTSRNTDQTYLPSVEISMSTFKESKRDTLSPGDVKYEV